MSQSAKVVAVTGVRGFVAQRLLAALEESPQVERVLALDSRPPPRLGPKTVFERLDLVHPRSPERLAERLADVGADALVHMAFLARPTHRGGWAHELEAIGTRHVLAAVGASGVRKLVLRSTTLTYGAHPSNPNYLPETAALRGGSQSSFIADKIEAEAQTTRFAEQHPDRVVTVLRLAPLLGPTADTIATIFLRRRLCPTLLGFDPLVQVLHEDDARDALVRVLEEDHPGAFNVGGPGVVPLSRAIALSGATAMPVPSRVLRGMSHGLWTMQLGDFPPGLVPFLKYPCVADLRLMRERLRLEPTYDVVDALRTFAALTRHAA